MKTKAFLTAILAVLSVVTFGQNPVKATIKLKDGKTIDVHHFGKLTCESNQWTSTFTTLKGKYNGSPTEISNYSTISKLILSGFTEPPVSSVGNQKAKITVIKKSGVTVILDDAELVMSCYGPNDKYNEIHVQVVNPLTDKMVDMAIDVNTIDSITFN